MLVVARLYLHIFKTIGFDVQYKTYMMYSRVPCDRKRTLLSKIITVNNFQGHTNSYFNVKGS